MESQHHVINSTNASSTLNNGVEHRLHVRRRAADDAKHLGCCRLMLQCLPQFRIALLDLLEQPHVLDGDHRLIGEGFKQFYLSWRKWPDLSSANKNRTDGDTFLQ